MLVFNISNSDILIESAHDDKILTNGNMFSETLVFRIIIAPKRAVNKNIEIDVMIEKMILTYVGVRLFRFIIKTSSINYIRGGFYYVYCSSFPAIAHLLNFMRVLSEPVSIVTVS